MQSIEWKQRARSLLSPVVGALAELGVTPTAVTLLGLGLHVLSAVWIGFGRLGVGGWILLLAAICDAVDGELARRTDRVGRFGAFLDSSIDRIDETVVLAGIAAYFLQAPGAWGNVWAVVCVLALGGSLITSYTRARAEGLGLECKVGMFERPERVVVTLLGLWLGHQMLVLALVVLVTLSWYTVYQRIRHVQRLVGDDAVVSKASWVDGAPPPVGDAHERPDPVPPRPPDVPFDSQ